jgi:hypothetical protein
MGNGGRRNQWFFLSPKPECPSTFPDYLGVVLLSNYTFIQKLIVRNLKLMNAIDFKPCCQTAQPVSERLS